MSDNKRSPDESPGGISFSLSGPALISSLCLFIVLILVLHLLSGCVPVDASIRNNDGDGSACVVWGSKASDPSSSCKAGPKDTGTEHPHPL